jgi:hypothetical protein
MWLAHDLQKKKITIINDFLILKEFYFNVFSDKKYFKK